MNEDRMISMLSSLDDDLAEKVIDNLMEGVDCDVESIKEKARQKLAMHNKKIRRRRRLPYIAAGLLLFVSINTVYADEISQALKSLFNQTPVYSTMVEGKAYYLKDPLTINKDLTIDSIIMAEGKLEMNLTALNTAALSDVKIFPKNAPGTEYSPVGFSQDGENSYFLSFANAKEQNYNIKPFQTFDLQIGGKTYPVSLDEAKSLEGSKKLAASDATANKIDLVTVGANSIEKNGKQTVQLIASFKDPDMELSFFGKPKTSTAFKNSENLGAKGMLICGGLDRPEPVYAIDQSGTKHQLTAPANPKAYPVTTFDTDAAKDSQLTVQLPALTARYAKPQVAQIALNIPQKGEQTVKQEVDLFAQKAELKSIKRLSPTSAELTFALNTGANKDISLASFDVESPDIQKCSSNFNGDTAVVTVEFFKETAANNIYISYPVFVMNGNWTINLK